MAKIIINLNHDLGPILRPNRYAEKNRPELLRVAAARYLKYLRNRYLRLSRGGGEWAPLRPSTIKRKIRRAKQYGFSGNPEHILRESRQLYQQLKTKEHKNEIYVGFVQDVRHYRGRGTTFLAIVHTKGMGVVPVRRVLGSPDTHTKKAMVNDIRVAWRKIQARNRK